MARKEVEVVLKGKDEGASTVVERLAQRLKLMRKESRMAGEGALERTLGSGRGLSGAALDAAGLGIQSIVVEAIGGAMDRVTAKALEMRDAFREGKVSEQDMLIEIAKATPLLGGFVSGFLNIRELITGEKAEVAEINRETAETNALLDKQAAFAKRVKEEHEESLDVIRQMKNEQRLVGAVDPARTYEQIRQKRENAEHAIDEKFKKIPQNNIADEFRTAGSGPAFWVRQHASRLEELDELVHRQNAYNKRFAEIKKKNGMVIGTEPGLGTNPDLTQADIDERNKLIDEEQRYHRTLAGLQKQQDAANAQRDADKKKQNAEARNTEDQENANYHREVDRKRGEAAREGELEIAQIRSEARQSELEEEGRHTEALMEAIRSRQEQEVAAAKAAAMKAIQAESDPDEQARILARGNAKIDAINQRAHAERERETMENSTNAANALRETLDAAKEDLDQEIDDTRDAISKFRDGQRGGRGARFSATLLSDRFKDIGGTFEDKEQARIQKNTAEAAATLQKMEEHLKNLLKQRAGREINA